MTNNELFLREEILLLALHDKKGTVPLGSMYHYAAGGAILAELLLRGRIAFEGENKLVDVVDPTPVGAPLLDESLERIRTEKRPAPLEDWLSRLAETKDLRQRIALHLCKRGIIRADEDKILFIFTREVYPEVDPGPEERLIERVREAVFTDREDIDPRTVILVSLADGTGLLDGVFGRKELKRRKARIERLTSGEVMGRAAGAVVEEMQAAMAATTAAIAASMAATTAASASCSAASASC